MVKTSGAAGIESRVPSGKGKSKDERSRKRSERLDERSTNLRAERTPEAVAVSPSAWEPPGDQRPGGSFVSPPGASANTHAGGSDKLQGSSAPPTRLLEISDSQDRTSSRSRDLRARVDDGLAIDVLDRDVRAPVGETAPHYPDSLAQTHTNLSEWGFQTHFAAPAVGQDVSAEDVDRQAFTHPCDRGEQPRLFPDCPAWAAVGLCEQGHMYAAELQCGREWCEECREKRVDRRKARWMPKVRQMATMGYLVLTVPPERRGDYRSARALSELGCAVKRLLQRKGFARGLRRWHFFGDDQDHGYHPHLNVLVDGGWLSPELLDELKESAARILHVSADRVNLHYQYTSDPVQMLHIMKYVLRPTFLDASWDDKMSHEVIGLRNTLTWGKWDDEPAWDLAEPQERSVPGASLALGVCPVDGSRVRWMSGVSPASMLRGDQWRDLGAGYWQLDDRWQWDEAAIQVATPVLETPGPPEKETR